MSDDLARVLRRLRRSAALTQEELADASGLSAEGISALERGQRQRPHAHTVDQLIAGLKLKEAEADELRAASRPPRRDADTEPSVPARGGRATQPHQLLAPPAAYVGREAEIERVVAALTAPLERRTPQRVAITGMGGIGKSSLALLAAHRVAEHYPDGQIYLDLHGQGDGEPMPTANALAYILTSLGVRDADVPSDPELAAAQLRTITNGARLLVLLDNAAGIAQVEPLLTASPASAVVITSREQFSGPMDVMHVPLALLGDDDAYHLLAEVAGADRLADDTDASGALVQACAGLPLALRLVGARLQARPSWPVAHLAERLGSDPAGLVDLGGRDVGATLVGSIDQLATSADPADHDAAAAMHIVGLLPAPVVSPVAIAAACGWDRGRAESAIERLVEVSLVDEPAPGAFRAHDLIHAMAADRAVCESGETALREVRARVLRTYRAIAWRSRELSRAVPEGIDGAAMVESNDPTTDPVECIDVIARDIEQILALAKAVVADGPQEARLVAHTVLGLISYYFARADSAGWPALLELALSSLPEDATDERICLHLDFAQFHAVRGHTEQASVHAEQVIRWAEPAGRHSAAAAAHSAEAIGWRIAGELDRAEASCRAAIREAVAAEDDRAHAAAQRDLGLVRLSNGDAEGGLEAEEEALAIYRRLQVPRGVAMALVNAGVMLRDLGRMEQARGYLEEAVTVAHDVTDRALEAEALNELGYWHVLAGEPGRGLEMLTDGLALVDVRGGAHGEASIRHRLALALQGLGRTEEADQHWEAAIRLHEQHGENLAAEALRQTRTPRACRS